MEFAKRFDGRVALVTGAGSGMGRAISQRLAREGARVVAVDVDEEKARETLAGLEPVGLALAADVTNEDAMNEAAARAVREFGRLDIGVNVAGIGGPKAAITRKSTEQFRRVLDVNLVGVFISCKAEARQMVDQGGGGVIVNISSTATIQPSTGAVDYCTSKAGVGMLTQVAAIDLAPKGIRVVAVAPGLTETPMGSQLLAMKPGLLEGFLDNIPLKRMAQPEEIASAVAFLASDEAAYITGSTLFVDGGMTTQRGVPAVLEL